MDVTAVLNRPSGRRVCPSEESLAGHALLSTSMAPVSVRTPVSAPSTTMWARLRNLFVVSHGWRPSNANLIISKACQSSVNRQVSAAKDVVISLLTLSLHAKYKPRRHSHPFRTTKVEAPASTVELCLLAKGGVIAPAVL